MARPRCALGSHQVEFLKTEQELKALMEKKELKVQALPPVLEVESGVEDPER